jgi:hypothetical protein
MSAFYQLIKKLVKNGELLKIRDDKVFMAKNTRPSCLRP